MKTLMTPYILMLVRIFFILGRQMAPNREFPDACFQIPSELHAWSSLDRMICLIYTRIFYFHSFRYFHS